MSTVSPLNSLLTALGGTNGIDVNAAVSSILDVKRAPERGWAAEQATLGSKAAAINQLQAKASTLSDALNALQNTSGSLSTVSAATSNNSLLTASAVAGTPSSTHLITIDNLASTGSWYSAAASSSTAELAAGSFDITTGNGTTTIQVDSGTTLGDLATSINARSLGVTANVITDSSGARLSLVSTASGSAADLSISNNNNSLSFTRANFGKDALIRVDGVPIQNASNVVTGAIAGVTLNLQGSSATEISLSLAPDTNSIVAGISTFVSAYNSLITEVNGQFAYNKATKTAGVLQTDSAVQSLQSDLLAATNYTANAGSYASLTSLGVTTRSDGTLSLDVATLTTAIRTDRSAVAQLFQGTVGDGFVASLNAALNTYTDPTQGAFTIDLKSISAETQSLTTQTQTLELYLVSQKTVLTAQYNAADIAIQQLPQKLKQIQALLNPNSSSSS